MREIDYFFTPVSPWTYLGHPRFAAIASIHEVKVNILPCDLGKVFSVSGGLPLRERSQQRRDYRLIELRRWSGYLGTPINLQPKHFPVSPGPASQLIIAADLQYGTPEALALAWSCMRACWAEERDISDEPTLAAIARECSLDPERLARSRAEAGTRYDRNTEHAMRLGVFGAPWYVYAGEAYWGQDRLDFLERAIAADG